MLISSLQFLAVQRPKRLSSGLIMRAPTGEQEATGQQDSRPQMKRHRLACAAASGHSCRSACPGTRRGSPGRFCNLWWALTTAKLAKQMKRSRTQTGGEQTVEWKLQLYEYKISTRRM